MAETVSNTPWSNFKESDYTDEQWLRACLIDRGADAGTAKQRASLPVREPSGTLNRNAVHAAAGALAGARGGLKNVSADLKAKAKRSLVRLYGVLGEETPPSLSHSAIDNQNGGTVANTTAAIMALPAPMEPIRLVGDEEKHATLLYFGETSTLPGEALKTLQDAVELASGMLWPCGESVVDVMRLGDEVPPALVALLSGESLSQVRNLFLMNPDVNGFQDNAQQHSGFTPHVTLSHPDFTDEAIQRALMRQVFRVRFDRLSVWWNDERFDFPLGPPQDKTSMSNAIDRFVAQHALEDGDHLEHHGVKGQKWGVRRAIDSATGRVEQTGNTGLTTKLKPRTGSADQITQDRIQKKIDTVGVHALSTAELQSYSRRLQVEKDVNRALAEQSAAQKEASRSFINKLVRKQAGRQADRVIDKALDVAVEKALQEAGLSLGKKGGNPDLADLLVKTSSRLQPKKK